MSNKQVTASAEATDAAQSGTKSGQGDVPAGDLAAGPRENVLTLELADLLRDSNGEIVLYNDSHLPALAVRADSAPVESGEIGSHVTAAGDDVTGYRFVAFDNGTKLFYQDSTDLVILGASSDTHG
jgi:hypothetical protein